MVNYRGQVYAFTSEVDNAFTLKHELQSIYKMTIPRTLLTDSKQLFDVMTKATHTTEKRLISDVAAAREAYKQSEI